MIFERPDDALHRGLPLRHSLELPVLGIPVRVRSNARAVVEVAESSFGDWRALERHPDLLEAGGGVDVRLVVHDAPDGAAGIAYRRPDATTMVFYGAGCAGFADAQRGIAVGYVTPAMASDVEQFRYTVLEALVLFLVTGPNRYPLHASAIARRGVGLLLAGPGGSGKSTLAWAARGGGWEVLSDDVVYVQSSPVWRIWGAGSRSYLPADAAHHFPDLSELEAEVTVGGRRKLVVRRAAPVPPVCARAGICLLTPGAGSPHLEAMSEAETLDALTSNLEPGFDDFVRAAPERLLPLAQRGWRLRLGPDPHAAIPLLERAYEALGGDAGAPGRPRPA